MAAYTIQEFITRAESGGGVSLSASTSVNLIIDGTPYTIVNTPSVDIGQYFSARQLLECYSLRAAIVAGVVSASAGVVSLSITPGV